MARDPHEKEPDKPFWKLLAHAGQPHEVVLARAPARAPARKHGHAGTANGREEGASCTSGGRLGYQDFGIPSVWYPKVLGSNPAFPQSMIHAFFVVVE